MIYTYVVDSHMGLHKLPLCSQVGQEHGLALTQGCRQLPYECYTMFDDVRKDLKLAFRCEILFWCGPLLRRGLWKRRLIRAE
jgi:hypothetical protein